MFWSQKPALRASSGLLQQLSAEAGLPEAGVLHTVADVLLRSGVLPEDPYPGLDDARSAEVAESGESACSYSSSYSSRYSSFALLAVQIWLLTSIQLWLYP